ncbi:DUF3048 domain-containing protein [Patescibacteria group bacterium]
MAKRSNGVKDYTWGAKRSKKKVILIALAVVVVVGAAVGGFLYFSREEVSNGDGPLGPNMSEADFQPRVIDGVKVPASRANLFPVAVMIENLVSSRPPSGLVDANVVYEALAEGGITRFMAIYASGYEIEKIGPVRSARPYYLDWAKEYGALYAHIGGSQQALSDIQKYDIFDLNQFFNAQYFWRDSERVRPHNLYTSSQNLSLALRDLDAPATGDYDGWTFKEDADDLPTTEKTIQIEFSSINYLVNYTFNRENNHYVRNLAGEAHLDLDGRQIVAKNVIVQFVQATHADDEGRLSMKSTGEGDAVFFIDGKSIEGTWEKESMESRTEYLDSTGEPIEFNAGTIWIEIVPSENNLTYT